MNTEKDKECNRQALDFNIYFRHCGFSKIVVLQISLFSKNVQINNDANEELYRKIQEDRRVHLTPSAVHGKYFIRISMTSSNNNAASVENCWQIIKDIASQV